MSYEQQFEQAFRRKLAHAIKLSSESIKNMWDTGYVDEEEDNFLEVDNLLMSRDLLTRSYRRSRLDTKPICVGKPLSEEQVKAMP